MMVTVDPLNKFKDVPKYRLVEACGVLPLFFAKSVERLTEEAPADDIYKAMMDIYGFGFGNGKEDYWGTVKEDGTLVSNEPDDPEDGPADPDLFPYMSCKYPDSGVELLIYSHAITVVRDTDDTFITRMD
jgi:hypothetical protein